MLTMPLLQVSSLKNHDIENVLSINDNQETNGNLQHWYLISRRGCLVILKKTFTNQTLAHVDGKILKLHSNGIMSIYFSQRYPLIKT
jgi:hypothetical protein